MSSTFLKSASFLISLVALAIVGSTGSVRAQTPLGSSDSERQDAATAPGETIKLVNSSTLSVEPLALDTPVTHRPENTAEHADVQDAKADSTQSPEETAEVATEQPANAVDLNAAQAISPLETPNTAEQNQQIATVEFGVIAPEPIPGTTTTSAAPLLIEPQPAPLAEVAPQAVDSPIAQTDVDPGRTTRGGRSYVGIGGNIGLGGDTALGDGSFVVNGKLGLTDFISFRPAAIIGNDTVFLLPITYDFTIRTEDPFGEPFPVAPFVGAGAVISTDEDDNFGFMLTGGVDVPISAEFVANASVNVGFIEGTTEAGLLIGVGYTFAGF